MNRASATATVVNVSAKTWPTFGQSATDAASVTSAWSVVRLVATTSSTALHSSCFTSMQSDST